MREHTLCSDDLGEVPEAERLDDMRLYGCGLLVYGIGAECGADHGRAGRLPLGAATSFAIASATSCGFGASGAWNIVMKCLNMLRCSPTPKYCGAAGFGSATTGRGSKSWSNDRRNPLWSLCGSRCCAASVRDSHHRSLLHRSRVLGAHVWPWPVLRPRQVGRTSGVNQEMNFFRQNGGNVSDDVTP
jgi:hypothetical protein